MSHYHDKQLFICIKCGEEKDSSEFYYHKTRHERIKSCKECNKKQSVSYQSGRRSDSDPKFLLQSRAGDIRRRCKFKCPPVEVDDDLSKTLQNLWVEQGGKCYYTGLPMSLRGYHTDLNAATVDRVNPELGYTKANVVLCRRVVNAVKQNLSIPELLDLCTLLVEKLPGLRK